MEELQRLVLGKEFLRGVEWEVNWMISKVLPIPLATANIYRARHWAYKNEDKNPQSHRKPPGDLRTILSLPPPLPQFTFSNVYLKNILEDVKLPPGKAY